METRLKRYAKKLATGVLSIACFSLVACVGPRLAERPPVQPDTQELAYKVYGEMKTRNNQVESVRGEASLRMSKGIFSRAMDQYLLIQRPDRLRIDSYDPSGTLIAQLVYAERMLYYSEPATGYFRSSDDAARLLQEEIGLDIAIDQLLLLFSGGIPLEPETHYLAVAYGGNILLRGMESQVEIKEDTRLPFRYVRRLPSGALYEVKFDNYQVIDGIWFPIHVEIKVSDPEFSSVVNFLGVELNQPIDPGVFAPPVIPVEAGWGE